MTTGTRLTEQEQASYVEALKVRHGTDWRMLDYLTAIDRLKRIIDRLTAQGDDTSERPVDGLYPGDKGWPASPAPTDPRVADREALAAWFAKYASNSKIPCDAGYSSAFMRCIKEIPACGCAKSADALLSSGLIKAAPTREQMMEALKFIPEHYATAAVRAILALFHPGKPEGEGK